MIPQFPTFKKLEYADKTDVEKITDKYPVYSDFNFTSLWSWDVRGEMRISKLNGNLVVRFTDYVSGKPFYSFLGTSRVEKTAQALLKLAQVENIEQKIMLLPEVSVTQNLRKHFLVEEDRDNFDYVYSLPNLKAYAGKPFETKRNLVNRFKRACPKAEVRKLDLADKRVQKEILGLNRSWLLDKIWKSKNPESKNESIALKRLFAIDVSGLVSVGLYSDSKLLAFCINEILHDGCAISHFAKASSDSSGCYAYLMSENARILLSRQSETLNFEQDLGLPNLRYAKSSFRPIDFLRKYTLRSA